MRLLIFFILSSLIIIFYHYLQFINFEKQCEEKNGIVIKKSYDEFACIVNKKTLWI